MCEWIGPTVHAVCAFEIVGSIWISCYMVHAGTNIDLSCYFALYHFTSHVHDMGVLQYGTFLTFSIEKNFCVDSKFLFMWNEALCCALFKFFILWSSHLYFPCVLCIMQFVESVFIRSSMMRILTTVQYVTLIWAALQSTSLGIFLLTLLFMQL